MKRTSETEWCCSDMVDWDATMEDKAVELSKFWDFKFCPYCKAEIEIDEVEIEPLEDRSEEEDNVQSKDN